MYLEKMHRALYVVYENAFKYAHNAIKYTKGYTPVTIIKFANHWAKRM